MVHMMPKQLDDRSTFSMHTSPSSNHHYNHNNHNHHYHGSSRNPYDDSAAAAALLHLQQQAEFNLTHARSHSQQPHPIPLDTSNPALLPGKRGKLARVGLLAMVLFPPFSIVLLMMLPVVAFVCVVAMYSIAWMLYYLMASPVRLPDLPWNPRRIWRLNNAFFGTILSNFKLLPVVAYYIRWRYFTFGKSANQALQDSLRTDVHYNDQRPDNLMDIYIPTEQVKVMDARHYRRSERSDNRLHPVIVFIYGGAWSSGSRLIYTLVGVRLRQMGYVVMIPDYTLYPKGQIEEMEQDVGMAIRWAVKNCREFGGDPTNVYLMGHSAGAHLCALTVLNDAIQRIPDGLLPGGGSGGVRTANEGRQHRLSHHHYDQHQEDQYQGLPRLRGMMLFSGVFDIEQHFKHEAYRGVEEISAMARVMGGTLQGFRRHSPTILLRSLLQESGGSLLSNNSQSTSSPTTANNTLSHHSSLADASTASNNGNTLLATSAGTVAALAASTNTLNQSRHQFMLRHLKGLLPMETILIHGSKDGTVPMRSSREFFMELKMLQLGSGVRFQVMEGMSHTEPVVGIMPTMGATDPFCEPLMNEIRRFVDSRRQVPMDGIRRK